jgi:hypothetical protein
VIDQDLLKAYAGMAADEEGEAEAEAWSESLLMDVSMKRGAR